MKIISKGKSEFERFDNAVEKLLSVSHEEMQKRIAADPRGHTKPKRKKRNSHDKNASKQV
jgi:hypothetical protein